MKSHFISVLVFTLALYLPPLAAQDSLKNVASEAARAGFNELERQLIKKYIGEVKTEEKNSDTSDKKKEKTAKGLPPGLAKRDSLPPGLAAQLQRNGTLPPGLAKRKLPDELEKQLPPVKEGYERSILEDLSVVLIEKASGRIADIISDAVMDDETETDRRN